MERPITIAEFAEKVTKGTLLSSDGGVMLPAAFEQFWGDVETNSALLANANRVTITAPEQEIHQLNGAARQLRKAVPGTAATAGTLSPVERTLTPSRVCLAFDISFDWLEDNARRTPNGDANQLIMAKVAALFAADLTDLAANGDGTTVGFLECAKGWLQRVTDDDDSDVNTYDATNATLLGASGIFAQMRNVHPTQYRRDAIIICNSAEADQYLDELGARATGLGDQVLTQGGPFPWQGFGVIGSTTWPVDRLLMTPRWNLIFGVWKDVEVFYEANRRKHVVEYTIDARVGFQLAVGDAATEGLTN